TFFVSAVLSHGRYLSQLNDSNSALYSSIIRRGIFGSILSALISSFTSSFQSCFIFSRSFAEKTYISDCDILSLLTPQSTLAACPRCVVFLYSSRDFYTF